MACGIGVCMSCVLPVRGTDGITRMVRSCVDGPVFRGDQVRWDDVGTIPFDALGAPGWKPPREATRGPRPRPRTASPREAPPATARPALRPRRQGELGPAHSAASREAGNAG